MRGNTGAKTPAAGKSESENIRIKKGNNGQEMTVTTWQRNGHTAIRKEEVDCKKEKEIKNKNRIKHNNQWRVST